MKVLMKEATAAQLREFIAEQFGIETHESATKANLARKLGDLGFHDESFVLSAGAAKSAEQAGGTEKRAAKAAAKADATATSVDVVAKALIQQGMPKDQAEAIASHAVQSEIENRPLPTGADAENLWCKIRLQRGEEEGGSDPVPVGVNGVVQLIPRGEEVDVRMPFVEVLRHATRLVFSEIKESDGIRTRLVPREVQSYPMEFVGAPYAK